jgi:glycosyltransferase involved in cell wall biosynthesis
MGRGRDDRDQLDCRTRAGRALSMDEKIVVCTPTIHRMHNGVRSDNLQACIDSVLGQTYSNLEQVVVRDRCPDGDDCALCRETDRMLADYASRDPRLRFLVLPQHQDPYGYFSRNLAIQNSDSPLIAYCDDDVWWEPDHLQSLTNAMHAAHAVFAFSGSNVRDHHGQCILHRVSKRPYFTGIDLNEILHRRELLTLYGLWNLSYNADWEAVKVWLEHQEPYAATGTATSNYRIKPGFPSHFWFFYSYWKHRIPYLLSR